MEHNKDLPAVHDLLNLANSVHFPASRDDAIETAVMDGFSHEVINFLNLFAADTIFDSKVDFMTRAEGLEMFVEQEEDLPTEINRGP